MGQAASYGLTQYDVDELIAYTNGACESYFAQTYSRLLQETGTTTQLLEGNMTFVPSVQSPKQKLVRSISALGPLIRVERSVDVLARVGTFETAKSRRGCVCVCVCVD